MRSLNLYGNVDAAICALDSINHLESIDDVKRFLKEFIFSVNQKDFLFLILIQNLSINPYSASIHLYMTQRMFTVFGKIAVKTAVF